MWSPAKKMQVPASSNLVIARIQPGSTNRALSVLVSNLGPGPLVVGNLPLGTQQSLAWTITSGDLAVHTAAGFGSQTDIELSFSDAP
jgi:hypothetical protein